MKPSAFDAGGTKVEACILGKHRHELDLLKPRQLAAAGWLTAIAPSKSLTVIPPDYSEEVIPPQDPRQPAMVKAWGLLDVAVQMMSVYRLHSNRIKSIFRKRKERLTAQSRAGVKRMRADPAPGERGYDEEEATIIACAAEEDYIDRCAGVELDAPPDFEDMMDYGDLHQPTVVGMTRQGREVLANPMDSDGHEDDAPTPPQRQRTTPGDRSDAGGSLAGDVPMKGNPTFEMPSPPHVAMTRAAAAAAASAAAGGVQGLAYAGGASTSAVPTVAAGAAKIAGSGGAPSPTGSLYEAQFMSASRSEYARMVSARIAAQNLPGYQKHVPYIRMARPPTRMYFDWDLQDVITTVEDLGLDWGDDPGFPVGRIASNVDEKLFVQAAKLAVELSRAGAWKLPRYVLERPNPVGPAIPAVPTPVVPTSASAAPSKVLTFLQKVEYMKGMMLHYMHTNLQQEFMSFGTPQEILDALEDEHLDRLKASSPRLRAQLLNLKMLPGEEMRVYMLRGRELCRKIAEAGCPSSEHEDIMSILRGVSEYKYRLPLAQLVGHDPLEFWSVLDLFTKNTNWMGNFTDSTPSKQPVSGLFAPSGSTQVPPRSSGTKRAYGRGSTTGRGQGSGSGRPGGALCSFCRLPGHTVDTCWRKTPALNPHYRAPGGSAGAPTPAHLVLPPTLTQKQLTMLIATVEGMGKWEYDLGSVSFEVLAYFTEMKVNDGVVLDAENGSGLKMILRSRPGVPHAVPVLGKVAGGSTRALRGKVPPLSLTPKKGGRGQSANVGPDLWPGQDGF
eukprot:gene1928-33338_t